MVEQKLYIVRESVMGTLILFSIIVLGVNAHFIFLTLNDVLLVDGFSFWPLQSSYSFPILSLAVAVLTLLTLPAMVIIDRLRKRAFSSMIVFELSWLGVLFILWIAAASFTTNSVGLLVELCGLTGNGNVHVLQDSCSDVKTSEAFGHLSWIILFGYLLTLLVLSIQAAQKGVSVWYHAVRDTEFSAEFTLPGFGNENGGQHDPEAAKEADNTVAQQNLGYAYPPGTQPTMQQYNPAQQQGQTQAPYGQAPGQPYALVPAQTPTQVGSPAPSQTPTYPQV
ncbi:hypothetical protein EUX98_g7461 [Antrodiella citrinella]|uniref:MARVEL domain-containing protein n=1 Tax=Antrodiella citrinella TaxID=2447956 RepID=A0A4S4MND3_9APHY|nr:hypothetical protein EUX98_g7461 [Antrodiella citrinella]